jgi:hypothetical protein
MALMMLACALKLHLLCATWASVTRIVFMSGPWAVAGSSAAPFLPFLKAIAVSHTLVRSKYLTDINPKAL